MSGSGEAFRDKLRRLRRDAEAPSSSRERSTGAALPAWLQRRLKADPGAREQDEPGVPRSVEPLQRLEARENERGAFAERCTRFGAAHLHGSWRLEDVEHASTAAIALLARDPLLEALDLRAAVYLDIETTGLSGGAGNTAFLVGLGSFDERGFEMWQGFLPGPEHEPALLLEVARRIREREGVVSFFGKSFDRHRLEDKMRLHGIPAPFEGRAHLDLYHPLRWLYGAAYEDARLSTMETRLCGLVREDDLPGRYAGEAWLDHLAGRASRLEAVFRHNLDDVLSLVVLAAHLGRTLAEERADGEALAGSPAARCFALARLYAMRGEPATALEWARLAREREAGEARACTLLCADLERRLGSHESALGVYEELARAHEDRVSLRALVEIAKIREHRVRDLPAALEATRSAIRLLARLGSRPGDRKLHAALQHREARLLGRLPAQD